MQEEDAEEAEDVDPDTPIAFVDVQKNNFIECYAESVATVKGVEYTIGVPCDHAVALCSFDTDDQLVPIDLDDPLMDDVYPVAERYVVIFGIYYIILNTVESKLLIHFLYKALWKKNLGMNSSCNEHLKP